MKKSLKHIDGNSDKFWEIEVTGFQFTVTYGKNGTAGTSQTKSFASEEECMKTAKKLVAEKIKKGYSETGEVTIISKAKTAKTNNTDEILEEYDRVICSGDINRLLTFFKEKSKGNLEVLKKYIKKKKNNGPFIQTIRDSITLSAIALFNKTEINSQDEVIELLNKIDKKPQILDLLLWVKPTWLESFILDKSKREIWRVINYPNLRKLESLGLIQFNPELYALSLTVISEHRLKVKMSDFIVTLLNDKVTCQRDIPQLFNYPTNLNHYTFWENNTRNSIWALIFKSLLEDKKMTRSFFIENVIQIQTKEWNNDLKTFFRKRIEELNPTVDELILQQEKIFSLLHYSYPPITSYGMGLVKQIYDHPKFKTKSFLEWLEPLMMRNDCKAAIKNVLPILEKLSKTNPKLSAAITSIITNVYVIADLNLQERVTKIITKIGNVKDKALKEKLSSYVTLMQGNIKLDLTPFLDQDALIVDDTSFEEYTYNPKKELLLTEEVTLAKDWNAVLFQFKNFISSDEILDAEILMNAYIQQRDLFPADCSAYYEGRSYGFCVHKDEVGKFLNAKMSNTRVNHPFWQYSKINTYFLIKPLLEKVEHKIDSNSILPLLSFPSHKPYWVAPKVLLERIITYQKTNEEIDFLDLAIAIARMPRENVEEAIPLLDQVEGELKSLLSFCMGVNEKIELNSISLASKELPEEGKDNHENAILALWAVAARTFHPNATFPEFENTYLKDIPFVVNPFVPEITFNEESKEWYYINGEITRSPSWYELRFDMPNYAEIPNYLLYSLDIYTRSRRWENNLNEVGNMFYWQSLTPQNTDALALILLESSYTTSGVKQELKGFLNLISKSGFQFSDISLLLYACCFFQESKEIKLLASDELINLVERQAIDVDTLAQKFAFLLAGNYGVFSRMTDCIITLKDVSPLHNSALLKLLNSLFEHLDVKEKLPANFKKLVENYVDVLTKTNQKPSAQAITFFEQWKDNPSLKSLIKQILK
jgi:predicted DNA-binding WGR domain protein